MWLEITSNCQLECSHCYASSGPGQGHGIVSADQWMQTLTEAAIAGVQQVQFIGGEPTSHPALSPLITHARQLGLRVEVFSNLFSIREHVWQALTQPGVSLATSYYSVGGEVHDQITHRAGSYGRTRANIAEAARRGIPLRVGIIRLSEDQGIDAAVEELVSIGVHRSAIGVDDQRGVGRGRGTEACVTEDELCGKCADGVLAIMPDGTVQPCVFSRDARFKVGNIAADSLTSVLNGERLHRIREDLTSFFLQRGSIGIDCPPAEPTGIQNCGPACSPACAPQGNCNPIVNPPPCNPIAGHPPRPEPPTRPPGPVCGPYSGR
ncbi:radical SAM/SPASM domain-containing protein [Amycolatopsis sp. H20-H5]|uniref:radical SAM/SPASM domain-containing protein n=1 Tax=Amycolatopsis sp. H20-H5 TaxID=3046309 RepID=UPI002DB99051|nr:radical SAM protein [Amycolatopsis sp. H20-H5]MEC3974341.1 radical SAM protein [Amycolatopsis sp. H20-H5]